MVENTKKNVVLVGSSYSASLALKIGAENKNVDAVIAFSPGEYFKERGNTYIQDIMKNNKFDKPVFITSSKKEANIAEQFFEAASLSKNKVHFIPKSEGKHGASALWSSSEGNEEYWLALSTFLKKLK